MTITDHDLSDLLDALRSGEVTDTIRTSLEWVLQQLIEAEATAAIGAAPHQRTESRTAQRNGHRSRLSTPAGDVELRIPELRTGSFFPSLLERRRRIDRALFAVVMEAWVHCVSTRKVDDLVAALGVGSGISKSEVSRICAERPGPRGLPQPPAGPRGLPVRVRRCDLRQGPRQRPGRLESRRRGHRCHRHRRPGGPGGRGRRQRVRSVLDRVLQGPPRPRPRWRAAGHLRPPPRPQGGDRVHVRGLGVAALPGPLHAQRALPGPEGVGRDGRRRDPHRVRPTRRRSCPRSARRSPSHAGPEVPRRRRPRRRRRRRPLGVHVVPACALAQDLVDQPLERLNGEIKRRTNVVGIFPNDASVARLITAVVVETHDEWAVAERRYLSEASMAKLYEPAPITEPEEPPLAITA